MQHNYKMEEVIHHASIPAKILLQQMSGDVAYVAPHWHKDIELNLSLIGDTIFTVDGVKEKILPGDLNIINSGIIHSGDMINYNEHLEMITILWDYDFFAQYCENFSRYQFRLNKKPEVKKQIRDIMIKIAILYSAKSLYYEMRISSLLLDIGYLLLQECRIQHARTDLVNTTDNITEIAYNNGFPNIKSFINHFKKYYHTTPKQYRKKHTE